jgi:hypothetical protein
MRKQDAKRRYRGGVSADTHDPSHAPMADALFSLGTGSAYAPGPASPGGDVLRGPRFRRGISAEVRGGSLSPNPEFAISEPRLRSQNLEQTRYVPMEAAMVDRGFQDRSEFTETGLALMDTRQPLRPLPTTESTLTQMNMRRNMAGMQPLQLDFPEDIIRAQTGHPFAGALPMTQTPPNPATPVLVPWSICHECSLPNNISSALGRYAQCQSETCMYSRIPFGMRIPAPSGRSCLVASDHEHVAGTRPDMAGWTEDPTAESYPRATPGSNIMQDVGSNSYASRAQSGISDPNSSDLSWTLSSSQEERQPTSTQSVSDLLTDQDIFIPSLEDPQLLYTDPLNLNYIGLTENVGPISNDLQFQDISPSLQDTQLDPMDPSNFNFIGNQMDDFSNPRDNIYPFLDNPQFLDAGSFSMPQLNDSMWHGGNFDMEQPMNLAMPQAMITTTPQAPTMIAPHAMNMTVPHAMNTTTPQATTMTTPHAATMTTPHDMNMTRPYDMNMITPQAMNMTASQPTITNTTWGSVDDVLGWPGTERPGKRHWQARSQRWSPY